ncbi:MAG TPA: MarR family transcriptional regulator [Tenuifilaceae bacterium]|nr:MarR family transcriptional regulator [Tenuifilaceae bacterium]HPE17411.1 MarR family transcriptional regulator [Tenuifilaceae bacterium]HPJ46138.1 MarR family transcriptional regulator [Tenuifilaceae bacterium]HPQ34537.1 MarR family transcriptional regulator [Tenuifilaceae bacterium]HRX66886.1 MarR family transcriptional regulator [Tenuifilaceae bacterium]
MEQKEKVLQAIKSAGKPMKAGEISEFSGVEKKEVDKQIKKLVTEGVLHSPARCYYDLKK